MIAVTFVADFVCPFCLIGLRRLELAARAQKAELAITFAPFELEPRLEEDQRVNLRQRLREKYGDPQPMFARVEALARADGIPLDFARVEHAMSTRRAHALLDYASEPEPEAKDLSRAGQVARALYSAYFLEGRDLSCPLVLRGVAEGAGIPGEAAQRACTDPTRLAKVAEQAEHWRKRQVGGVPLTLIGSERIAGAQPQEVFDRAIQNAGARLMLR